MHNGLKSIGNSSSNQVHYMLKMVSNRESSLHYQFLQLELEEPKTLILCLRYSYSTDKALSITIIL